MKITTQRSSLWLLNFALLFCLLGFVFLMYKFSPAQRAKERRSQVEKLETKLSNEKPKPPMVIDPNGSGPRVAAVFNPKLHYAGYVAPPVKKKIKVPTGPQKAPALDSLIEVNMVIAPNRAEKGGPSPESAGASIRIKSKPVNSNVFWYREGDKIGISQMSTVVDDGITVDDVPDDIDPTLKRFGGAEILRILPDGLICKWADHGEVKVTIGLRDEPAGMLIAGKKIRIGSLKGGAGAKASPTTAIAVIDKANSRGNRTQVTITRDGFDYINSQGGKLMEGMSFEKSTNPRTKKPALQVKSIPRNLQNLGLQDGDIIIKIDATQVTSKESIVRYVRRTYQNRPFYNVTIIRDGRQRQLRVSVPKNSRAASGLPGGVRFGADR